jgi:predicted nuclease with TOPRIM domain
MLNDTEVKRLIESITEYKELVHHSSNVRDQLDSLQKRWNALRQEREKLRASLDAIHSTLSQVRADYQGMVKGMTDLSATEDTVLDNVKFLVDELTSLLKKHEVAA